MSFENLANDIEKMIEKQKMFDLSIYIKSLEPIIIEKNIDCLVLGCTHYPFVKDKMSKILNQNVVFFDGIDGTVAHLKDILEKNEIKNCSKSKGCVKIISSAKDPDAIMLYNKLLNGGIL